VISNHGARIERLAMLNSSKTFTSPVMDAPGVDPKLLMTLNLLSQDALVAAINEAIPNPHPCADEFTGIPDLVSDDGNSQRCDPSYHFFRSNVELISVLVDPILPHSLHKLMLILPHNKSTSVAVLLIPPPPMCSPPNIPQHAS